ncbi:hypothetical protein DL89DRAFT_166670 [Linderina pennispora]|uniref:Uncharacterized protein n=1 Tax=Linderina pennispora TaxID=61395 RepID=A0A1Y1VUK4_9FUNG|nr:uncharacterized protein DL89DRAFT_166670 [Linderina pennispora]ORX64695.1 hypothetical protein DL89DRAFT_166670 [Linderina pennispora]
MSKRPISLEQNLPTAAFCCKSPAYRCSITLRADAVSRKHNKSCTNLFLHQSKFYF